MTPTAETYPGALATPEQLRLLAEEYRGAAHLLLAQGRRGKPLSRAPFRLSAIQAIELHLNALLLHRGHEAAKVRSLQHDLDARTDLAVAAGLRLRRRTDEHLRALHRGREYLASRYGPELAPTASHVNRLVATLEEVASKVNALMAPAKPALPRSRAPAGVSGAAPGP